MPPRPSTRVWRRGPPRTDAAERPRCATDRAGGIYRDRGDHAGGLRNRRETTRPHKRYIFELTQERFRAIVANRGVSQPRSEHRS